MPQALAGCDSLRSCLGEGINSSVHRQRRAPGGSAASMSAASIESATRNTGMRRGKSADPRSLDLYAQLEATSHFECREPGGGCAPYH